MPMGAVPVPVTPMPPPPCPAPLPAPVAAALAVLPLRMYLMHNHPPGTACRPVSHTELQQALQFSGQ